MKTPEQTREALKYILARIPTINLQTIGYTKTYIVIEI